METKISVIKEELQAASYKELPLFISKYETDERSGVAALVKKARKQIDDYEKELLRTEGMKEYEKKYGEYSYICGIDEVGRGPLAGPVVAGAVILPKDCQILYLNDSKKLTEKKRDALFDVITERALTYGIASASVEEIEEFNILNATFLAMNRAVAKLDPAPELALIDGNRNTGITVPSRCIVGGDGKCADIAAASVLAKVTRDRYMRRMAETYPQYGFEKHKGYGTRDHYAMLDQYGPCPEHRMTFLKKWEARR